MATLFTPFFQAIDGNGKPYAGAKLYFYQTGTTTLQNTYSDSGLTTANANPVVADANGRFGSIYLGTGADYKVVFQTSAGVTIGTVDPIFASSTAGRVAVVDAAYSLTINDRLIAYTSITAARNISLLAASVFTAGTRLMIQDESGSASHSNTISLVPNGTDKINGLNTTQVVISSAYGSAEIESDGSSKWSIIRNADGRRAVADAATTITARDSLISYTSLTVSRQVTLPAATTYPAGKRLVIVDESGSASATVTVTVAPNGTDKLGGSNTTQALISYPYDIVELVSNGVDAWDILSSQTTGGTWTPADNSGAALAFTAVAGNWQKVGNLIYAWFTLTYPATANGATTSISGLPATVANNAQAQVAALCHNSGGAALTYARVAQNTSTFSFYSQTAGNYTNVNLSTLTITGLIIYPAT